MDEMVSGLTVETSDAAQESGTVRTRFDQKKTSPSMAVIATLAAVKDADPVELSPLQSTVDTDALDAIVNVRPGTEGDIRVGFEHSGREITVSSDGAISVSTELESAMRSGA